MRLIKVRFSLPLLVCFVKGDCTEGANSRHIVLKMITGGSVESTGSSGFCGELALVWARLQSGGGVGDATLNISNSDHYPLARPRCAPSPTCAASLRRVLETCPILDPKGGGLAVVAEALKLIDP